MSSRDIRKCSRYDLARSLRKLSTRPFFCRWSIGVSAVAGVISFKHCFYVFISFFTFHFSNFNNQPGYYATDSVMDNDGYGVSSGASVSNPCPEGAISESSGSIECEPCPEPKSSAPGSVVCNECIEGFFVHPSSGECKQCPNGASCKGGKALPFSKEGYWQDTSSAEALAHDHYECEADRCTHDTVPRVECLSSAEALQYCNSSSLASVFCAPRHEGVKCSKW